MLDTSIWVGMGNRARHVFFVLEIITLCLGREKRRRRTKVNDKPTGNRCPRNAEVSMKGASLVCDAHPPGGPRGEYYANVGSTTVAGTYFHDVYHLRSHP